MNAYNDLNLEQLNAIKQSIISESDFIEEFNMSFDRAGGWFCEIFILYMDTDDIQKKIIQSHGFSERECLINALYEYDEFKKS